MIETGNPQIDAAALLQRVRDEIRSQQVEASPSATLSAPLRVDAAVPAQFFLAEAQVKARVSDGRKYNALPSWMPGILQPFFRNQAAINRQLLHAVEQQQLQLQALWQAVEQQTARMQKLQTVFETRQRELVSQLLDKLTAAGLGNGQAQAAAAEFQASSLDAWYVAFEDKFRGPRAEIKRRIQVYLPHVGTRTVLDLGCGRGEWLELLREAGHTARGVDGNAAMVAACREMNLDVQHADIVAHLKTLPDAGIGVVTAFHVVEHLPYPVLQELLSEIYRVLRPGGVTILETPNPENLQVGAHRFYSDPTHQRPLPPALLEFLCESAGFVNVVVVRQNPYPSDHRVPAGEPAALIERFNEFLYGPQDYAVIARKMP